jgi:ribosomal protein S27E
MIKGHVCERKELIYDMIYKRFRCHVCGALYTKNEARKLRRSETYDP